jgi:hypothetical protein
MRIKQLRNESIIRTLCAHNDSTHGLNYHSRKKTHGFATTQML